MKAQDMISLMEYMKAFSKSEKTPKKTPEKKEKNFFEAFAEMKVQVDQFQQFLKDQEKLNKKEEKKEEKGLSVTEWMMILNGLFPIIGLIWLATLLRAAGKI